MKQQTPKTLAQKHREHQERLKEQNKHRPIPGNRLKKHIHAAKKAHTHMSPRRADAQHDGVVGSDD